jgi:hypothetical protein
VTPLSVKEIRGGPGQLTGEKLAAVQGQRRALLVAGGS